ncbi:MAG: hypothetical protein WBL61_18820 [Bryobacteraceae bacterium]
MARLKQPLNADAVAAADDDFYDLHHEMVVDGQRQPIDSSQVSLKNQWVRLYVQHGGELEKDPPADLDFEVTWVPDMKHDQFREGAHKGSAITAVKSHVYFVRASRLMVAQQWPLAEYYAYIDTDLAETIDFDTLGLLWTDEKGFPHLCDGDGKPQERVEFFPFSYSTQAQDATSCVLIYDTDLGRLKKKRASLQGTNGKNSEHRVKELFFYNAGASAAVADIQVPRDNDILPVDEIIGIARECDALLVKAEGARDALKHFMEETPEHGVMWTSREAINGWLAMDDHRNYLTRLADGRATWDVACENFDREFKKLTTAYETALEPLYDKLSDSEVRRKLFLCDYVVQGWDDTKGYHGLWSCHFFLDAIGMFAGTMKHKEVFDNFAQPLLTGFAANWGQSRGKCKCPTCGEIEQVDDPFAKVKMADQFGKVNFKLKDLKIAGSTVQRVVNVVTKFLPNFALIMAQRANFTASDVSGIGWFGPNIFKRGGMVGKGLFKSFAEAWSQHVAEVVRRGKEFEAHAKELEDANKAILQKYLKVNPGKLGDTLSMLGGAIQVVYFFTKEGRNTKDWFDLLKASTDIARGGLGLGKDKLAEKLAEKYGAEVVKKFAKKVGEGLTLGGAAFQFGSAYLSLSEAADKGDRQAFVWGAVQYMGADIYLTGAAVEFTPFLGVSQASGAVVIVVGAVVYLTGQIGEFITRPGAEEKFLRGFYYYDDNDHRSPEEKEAEWQQRQERRRQERADRFSLR